MCGTIFCHSGITTHHSLFDADFTKHLQYWYIQLCTNVILKIVGYKRKTTFVWWSVWCYHLVWNGIGTPAASTFDLSLRCSYATPPLVITSYRLPNNIWCVKSRPLHLPTCVVMFWICSYFHSPNSILTSPVLCVVTFQL